MFVVCPVLFVVVCFLLSLFVYLFCCVVVGVYLLVLVSVYYYYYYLVISCGLFGREGRMRPTVLPCSYGVSNSELRGQQRVAKATASCARNSELRKQQQVANATASCV